MAFLEIANLHKRFGSVEVLKDINLEVEEGGFLVLVGPRAAGSRRCSTPSPGWRRSPAGEIRIDGRGVNDLHPARPRHRHGVPVLRALSQHDGRRRTSPSAWRCAACRSPSATRPSREVAETAADRPPARPQAEPALRRPAPARRHGPGAGARSRRSSCSTSRSPTSTPSCASTCAPRSSACTSA